MGLDWMVELKARKGHEDEVERLLVVPKTETAEEQTLRIRLLEDLRWVSPWEVLECPRIGVDEEATQMLRKDFDARPEAYETQFPEVPRDKLWKAVLKHQHGLYVPELAKNRDGLGAITGIAAPPHSYRGAMVTHLEILPPEVSVQAYEDMTPEQMLKYADELQACAERAIQQATDPDLADLMRRTLNEELEDGVHDFWVVRTACRWLRFWGSRGFSMWAWS